MRRLRWNATAAAAVLLVATAWAQPARAGDDWRWVRFGRRAGLPADRILGLAEASDGTVWVRTAGALAYFDGFSWHPLGRDAGLPPGRPSALVASRAGHVLTLVDGVAFEGDSGGFRPLLAPRYRPAAGVAAVACDRDGRILMLSGGRVHALQGGQLHRVQAPAAAVHAGTALWQEGAGDIWLSGEGRLYRWAHGDWRPRVELPSGRGLFTYAVENRAGEGVAFARADVGTRRHLGEEGVWSWSASEPPRKVVGEGRSWLVSAAVSERGDCVIAYETGALRWRHRGEWSTFAMPTGAAQTEVVRFRSNGDLWIGTRDGLYLYRASSRRWTVRKHPFGDSRDHISTLLRCRHGELWAGTAGGLEIQSPSGSWHSVREIDGEPLSHVTGLAEDAEGCVWVCSGATMAGARRWDGEVWRRFGAAEGLTDERIHDIVRDRQDRLWFLGIDSESTDTGPGVFVRENGACRRWEHSGDLPSGRVYALADAADGSLWFATVGGLSRYRDGVWRHWNTASGLRRDRVFTLALDGAGSLWFGHQTGSGLGCIDAHDRPRYLDVADGLIDDDVWRVARGRDGGLWLATDGGLGRLRDGTFSRFDGYSGLGAPFLWGLLCESERVIAGSRGGGLWQLDFGEADDPPPRVSIDVVRTDVRGARLAWTAHAFWGHTPSERVPTRHRVDGADWSPWGFERELELALPAGEHRLEVQAKSRFGVVRTVPDAIELRVPRPTWQRPQVLLPLLGLGLCVAVLGVAFAVRRRRHRRAVAGLREQLFHARKLEAIGRLAGGVAHDFNNQLTAIVGYAELARGSMANGDPNRARLEEIEAAAHRAAQFTAQLLAFARKGMVARSVISLDGLVRATLEMARSLLHQRIEIDLRLDAEPWMVHVDPGQVEQLVLELIEHGCAAMPSGGRLTLATRMLRVRGTDARRYPGIEPGEYVVLVVSDTGEGIEDDVLDNLFEPFFSSGTGRGSGLGMAACYGIVKQAGGYVRVRSAKPAGTDFEVYLPRAREQVAAVPARRGDRKVLLVDDDPAVRAAVERAVHRNGHELVAVDSAEAAMAAARAGLTPDLLITSVDLPGMSGEQLAERLLSFRAELPAIYLVDPRQRAPHKDEASGRTHVLHKPIADTRLQRLLDALLPSRRPPSPPARRHMAS